jgi:dihydroxyacetone kinase-like predicted kinase
MAADADPRANKWASAISFEVGTPEYAVQAVKHAELQEVSDALMFMGTKYGDDAGPLPAVKKLTGDIKEIDGQVFTTLVAGGYALLAKNKEELNQINVFPVPDADTGNNMRIALRGATTNLIFERKPNLQESADQYASDTLLNGQGNSGTVLSYFFITLAKELRALGGKASLPVADFAGALKRAGSSISSAFPPAVLKEGTIVTVVRKSVQVEVAAGATLKQLLTLMEAAAKIALYKTPDQLEVDGKFVLKEANVDCDSGAKGYYYVIKGMLDACTTDVDLSGVMGRDKVTSAGDIGMVNKHTGKEKFRYCTECVIQLKKGSTKATLDKLMSDPAMGDSRVTSTAPAPGGGGEMYKVHIHSDNPDKVFAACQEHNELAVPLKEKTDDMDRQVR